MNVNLECIYCTVKKADSLFSQYNENEEEKIKFMKKVFKIVSTFNENDTSPYLNALILRKLNSILGFDDIYFDIKKEYNKFIMSMEDEIFEEIQNSEDRMLSGLKYAMAGNFIDFGAMDSVDICKVTYSHHLRIRSEVGASRSIVTTSTKHKRANPVCPTVFGYI